MLPFQFHMRCWVVKFSHDSGPRTSLLPLKLVSPASFLLASWFASHHRPTLDFSRNILLVAFLIFFIAYVGFAFTRSIALIAVLFASYGLYQGILRSVGKVFAADFVPEALRASGIGRYNMTVGLLGLVASVVAGLLRDHVGHAAVFVYGALFAVIRSVALVTLLPAKQIRCRL